MKIDNEEKEARKFLAYFLVVSLNAKGITQLQLAEQLDMKKSAMNDIINGKTTPSLLRTLKLFEALNVDIKSFLHKWELLNSKMIIIVGNNDTIK